MRKILLLRHAKSAGTTSGSDKDRPITAKGEDDAVRIGKFIKAAGFIPNQIVCSSAKRARQTCEKICSAAEVPESAVAWNSDLYSGTVREYLSIIQYASNKNMSMMLVAHNPKIEELVSLVCSGQGRVNIRIPQGGLICIGHPALEWPQVKPGTGRLRWFVRPDVLENIPLLA